MKSNSSAAGAAPFEGAAEAPTALGTLHEMLILHYGTAEEMADQRARWKGAVPYEIANAIEQEAREHIAKGAANE